MGSRLQQRRLTKRPTDGQTGTNCVFLQQILRSFWGLDFGRSMIYPTSIFHPSYIFKSKYLWSRCTNFVVWVGLVLFQLLSIMVVVVIVWIQVCRRPLVLSPGTLNLLWFGDLRRLSVLSITNLAKETKYSEYHIPCPYTRLLQLCYRERIRTYKWTW